MQKFKLSQDYDLLLKLLKRGDVVPCYINYEGAVTHRDICKAKMNESGGIYFSSRGVGYLTIFADQIELLFKHFCKKENVEFFAPLNLGDTPKRAFVLDLHLHKGSKEEVARQLEEIAQDLLESNRDNQTVISGSGYYFTLAHTANKTEADYRKERDAYLEAQGEKDAEISVVINSRFTKRGMQKSVQVRIGEYDIWYMAFGCEIKRRRYNEQVDESSFEWFDAGNQNLIDDAVGVLVANAKMGQDK